MRLATALFLLALLAPCSALAQYSIDKVHITGGAPYTDAELLDATGLAPGQMLAHDSLAHAAQHLLDTGLFDDAQIFLSGQGKARTVNLTLKPYPPAKLLPTTFDSLAWFPPGELDQALRNRLPLYRGLCSDAGNFCDTIQTSLQALVAEKDPDAAVFHTLVEPTSLHPVRTVAFRLEKPAIRVARVNLSLRGPTGAAAALAPLYKPVPGKAAGSSLDPDQNGFTLEDRLLAPARDAGYLKAQLTVSDRTLTPAGRSLALTLTATVDTGELYKLTTIAWDPTPVYSAADFSRDAKLHAGDTASAAALLATEAGIASPYLAQGDMDVYVTSSPVFDDTAHTVAYSLRAVPGQPYLLRTVTVNGLDPAARKSFDDAFTMKPGEPYDAQRVIGFFKKHLAQPAFQKYGATYQASADPISHQVDLTFTFVRN